MRIPCLSRFTRAVLCLLLLWSAGLSRLTLGTGPGMSLVPVPAPELTNPMHLSVALVSPAFLGAVGGIAFDAVARPDNTLEFDRLALRYEPDSADGRRLFAELDGRSVPAAIFDWQLLPIARYADSPYYSCFTAFGQLDDEAAARRARDKGAMVLNYHPAFVNTLLGLRLFQLDLLIVDSRAADLPREDGNYILGAGESEPYVRANEQAMARFRQEQAAVEDELGNRFRSYVICDYERDIRFGVSGDSLVITGEPFFYCWRYRYEMPGFDQEAARAGIESRLKQEARAARAQDPAGFDENEWYITRAIETADDYDGNHAFYAPGSTLLSLIAAGGDSARRAFLRRYYPSAVRQMVIETRTLMQAYEVVHLRAYSEWLSSRPELVRSVNPTVWDAGVNTMRYAAFFRHVKERDPDAWQGFMAQIEGIVPQPRVQTPTVAYR